MAPIITDGVKIPLKVAVPGDAIKRRKFIKLFASGAAGFCLAGCGIQSRDPNVVNTVYAADMKVRLVSGESSELGQGMLGTSIEIVASGTEGEYHRVLLLNSVEIKNNGKDGMTIGNVSGVDHTIPELSGKYRIVVEQIYSVGKDVRATVQKVE